MTPNNLRSSTAQEENRHEQKYCSSVFYVEKDLIPPCIHRGTRRVSIEPDFSGTKLTGDWMGSATQLLGKQICRASNLIGRIRVRTDNIDIKGERLGGLHSWGI